MLTMTTEATEQTDEFKNILDHTDEEITEIAHPMWDELIKYSNEGKYGLFIKNFSRDLLHGLNEIEVGKQFAKSELTRNLSSDYDFLGLIRRGQQQRTTSRSSLHPIHFQISLLLMDY